MIEAHSWEDLYPGGICQPSDLIKSVLDQQIDDLARNTVSDNETRYPTDEPSMHAFLETFFTRHLFQLQRSIAEYITSLDFQEATGSSPLRILDIGAGPAVASLGIIDLAHRTASNANLRAHTSPRALRLVHVLNDTSPICLITGKRMLAACHEQQKRDGLVLSNDRVFTLSTPFPGNMHQIQHLRSPA